MRSARPEGMSMKRRDLMIGVAALTLGARAAAAPFVRARLGSTWTMPKGTSVELWPADLGLDLAGVLAAIGMWRIVPGARVTIRLPDGIHAQRGPVDLGHPDGIRLAIVGNVDNPERCRLVWQGPTDGLYCGAGAVLGRIDGVQIEHAAIDARGQGSGLLADLGGAILCGPRVIVRGFCYGCQARHGGVIRCPGMTSFGAGDAGYFASSGGHLHCEGAQAIGARDATSGLGSGFVAESGGSINAVAALAERNLLAGFTALSNGVIRAHRATAQGNGRAGFYASTGGTIIVHEAIARAHLGQSFRAGRTADGGTA